MPSIDNRIVNMLFENKQFEKGAEQTMKTLDELDKKLKLPDSGKAFDNITKAANSINLSGIRSGLDTIQDRFSSLGIVGMTVLQNLTNSALNLGKKLVLAVPEQIVSGGWNRAMNIEKAKFQLKGLKVAWEDLSNQIDYGVKDTAYGMDAAANVASQLVASGVKFEAGIDPLVDGADEMSRSLRAISGVAAMTNSSYEEIGSIFTTVAGQGKLMTMQLRQLEGRGLNAAAKLGEVLGKTESEVRDMVTDGKIDFQTFADAMDSAFGEHAKEANETFNGAFDNIKAALSRIGQDYATPIIQNSVRVFNALRTTFNGVRKLTRSFGENGFTSFMESITEVASSEISKWNFTWISDLVSYAERAASFIETRIPSALDKVHTVVDALNGSLSGKNSLMNRLTAYGLGGSNDLLNAPIISGFDLKGAGWDVAAKGLKSFFSKTYSFDDGTAMNFTPVYTDADGNVKALSPEELDQYVHDVIAGVREDDLNLKIGATFTGEDAVERAEHAANVIAEMREAYLLATPVLDNFKEAASNLWDVIKSIGSSISDAWAYIFPGTVEDKAEQISDKLNTFSEKVKDVTERIKNFLVPIKEIQKPGVAGGIDGILSYTDGGDQTLHRFSSIQDAFRGIFAVIDLAKQAVDGLWRGFKKLLEPLVSKIRPIANAFIDGAGSIGEWLVGLDEAARESDFFGTTFENVADWILNASENIKNAFNTVKQWATEAWSWLSETFSGLWESIGPTVTSIWNHLQEFWTNLTNFFSNISKGDKVKIEFHGFRDFLSWLGENVNWDAILNVVGKIFEFVGVIVNGLLGVIDNVLGGDAEGAADSIGVLSNALMTLAGVNIGTSLAAGGAAIIDFIGVLGGMAAAATAEWNISVLTNMGKAVLLIAGSLFLISTIDQDKLLLSTSVLMAIIGAMTKIYGILNAAPASSAAKAVEKTGTFWQSLGGSIKGFADVITGKIANSISGFVKSRTIVMFAEAVLIIVAAMWILSTIPSDKLVMALIGVVSIMVVLTWAFKQLTSTMIGLKDLKANSINQAGSTLTKLAVSLLIVSIAMKLIGSLDSGKMIMSLVAVVSLMVVMTNMVQRLAETSKDMKAVNLGAIALMLTTMASAMLTLSLSVALLSLLDSDKMAEGAIAIGALMYALTQMIISLTNATKSGGASVGQMLSMAVLIVVLANAMAKLALSVALLSKMDQLNVWSSVGAIVVMLYAMVGALRLLGGMAEKTKEGSTGIIEMAASILILGVAMSLIAGALKKLDGMNWKQLAAGTAALIVSLYAMVGALALLNKISWSAMGGSGDLVTMAASILILSTAMLILSPAIAMLGNIGWSAMIGVLAIAAALGVFIGAAALIDKFNLVPALLDTAGAMALFGAGVALFGVGLLAAGVALTAFSGSMALIGTSIIILLGTILNGIVVLAPMLTMAVISLISAVVNAIIGAADTIVTGVGTLIVTVVTALIKYAPVIMYGLGVLIFEVLAFLGTIVPNIVDDLVKLLLIIINSFSLAIVENGQQIGEAIRNLVMSLGQFIWEALDGIFGPLIEILFPDFYAKMTDVMNTGHGDLVTTLTENNDQLRAGMEQNAESMKEGWDNVISDFDPLGDIQNTVSDVSSGMGGVDMMSTDWANDMVGQFSEIGDLGGSEYSTHLSEMISDGTETVSSAAYDVADSTDSAKTNFKSNGTTAGGYYVDGAYNGAIANGYKAYNAGVYTANRVNAGFTNTLQIQSPSRVAMKYGAYWTEGIAIGVRKMGYMVEDAGSDVGGNAIDTMRDALLRVNDVLSSGINDEITICPVVDLSNVRAGVNAINGLFGSTPVQLNSGINVPNLSRGLKMAQNAATAESTSKVELTNNFYVQRMDEGMVDYFVNRINTELGARA